MPHQVLERVVIRLPDPLEVHLAQVEDSVERLDVNGRALGARIGQVSARVRELLNR